MLTLEQKIGQLLILGFVGTGEKDPGVKEITNLISLSMAGGVIHFRRNIASESQIIALNASFQAANPSHVPLLIACDQEGGSVVRTANIEDVSVYPCAKVFAGLGLAQQHHASKMLASRLHARGFNFNFAPCVDLDRGCPVISAHGRSFSSDPTRVVQCAKIVCQAHRDAGVIPCLKHYPGHGSAQGDTHEALVDVTKTHALAETQVFHRLVKDKAADAIMTAHLYHTDWHEDYPATMAQRVLSGLRAQGFTGVIISDDMHMGAIIQQFQMPHAADGDRDYRTYDYVRGALAAFKAGCDLLIYGCNASAAKGVSHFAENLDFIPRLIHEISAHVRAGNMSEKMIEDKYARVHALRTGIFNINNK